METWESLEATYGVGVINALPVWMTAADIAAAYLYEMIDVQGDSADAANNALETIRSAPQYREMYDSYFPGNRRPDGSLRLTEGQYTSRKQAYKDTLLAVSPLMNPDIFEQEYADLIAGDVSPDEFERRVSSLQSRVIANSGEIRDYYATNFGTSMTDEGILASLMSPRVNDAILTKQITMSEVGGEASMRNFDITNEFVEMLVTDGKMDRDQAKNMFSSAAGILPALGALAVRHGDPDDDFDITEFAQATALGDTEQAARIGRLKSQEQSQFTGSAQSGFTRSRGTGSVSGLEQLQ